MRDKFFKFSYKSKINLTDAISGGIFYILKSTVTNTGKHDLQEVTSTNLNNYKNLSCPL